MNPLGYIYQNVVKCRVKGDETTKRKKSKCKEKANIFQMIVMVDLTLFIEWHNNREVLESQSHDKTTTTTSCIIHEKKWKNWAIFHELLGIDLI